jgi:16S rRNA processing protein RimM
LEPGFPDDAVEVGRILGAWGVKGWLRIQPYASDPQALFSSKRWFVQPPEGGAPRPAAHWPGVLRVVQAREHGDGVVAQLHDVADRNAAEALRGGRLFIARSSFPTAGLDEYYWVDLIGLAVSNRGGELLGDVVGLIDTGAHSVLRVRPRDAKPEATPEQVERLIPFVAAYIDSVDLAERQIVADWGLDY